MTQQILLVTWGIVTLAQLGTGGLVFGQTARAPAGTTAVPKALADAGEYGENLYDDATASHWKAADGRLVRLRASVEQVRVETKVRDAAEDRLEKDVATLARAVAGRRRREAMQDANRITLDVADMTQAFHPRIPVQVTRLDYYGRELEIWSEAADSSRLTATTQGMRREWDAVRPAVARRDPRMAKTFEALVVGVEHARTPPEYRRLAEPVLDEVDNLERVFEH